MQISLAIPQTRPNLSPLHLCLMMAAMLLVMMAGA